MNIGQISKEHVAEFEKLVASSKKICIVSHKKPDGDAIGSSTALYYFLTENLGKDCIVCYPDEVPHTLSFLVPSSISQKVLCEDHNSAEISAFLADCDLICCLDFNNLGRIENLGAKISGATCPKVLIDHHTFPAVQDFTLCFSAPEASSACEFLYHILRLTTWVCGDSSKLPLPARRALYAGMTTDTNNFANSTSSTTFNMAADLQANQVDRTSMIETIFKNYPERRYRYLGHLLSENLRISERGVALMITTIQDRSHYGIRDGETEGFVNYPLEIDRVKISIFLKEDTDCYRVSLRSKGSTNVNILAADFFSGGGHAKASGGKLPLWSEDELVKYVFEHAEKYI